MQDSACTYFFFTFLVCLMRVGGYGNPCQFFGNFLRVAAGVVVVGRLLSLRTWAGPCWAGVMGRYRPSPNGTASGAAGVSGTCCFALYSFPALTSEFVILTSYEFVTLV